MTTPRARLLAILKEPDRYFVRYATWSLAACVMDVITGDRASEMLFRTQAETLTADLNARHRLKRLCEEYTRMVKSAWLTTDTGTLGDADYGSALCEELAAAIAAFLKHVAGDQP